MILLVGAVNGELHELECAGLANKGFECFGFLRPCGVVETDMRPLGYGGFAGGNELLGEGVADAVTMRVAGGSSEIVGACRNSRVCAYCALQGKAELFMVEGGFAFKRVSGQLPEHGVVFVEVLAAFAEVYPQAVVNVGIKVFEQLFAGVAHGGRYLRFHLFLQSVEF